ncbi:hypothetical protein LZ31DRAFT_378683 [Colletotrichum somersetense]|nr:hypothetical protein LZ31DRAFT_378683 [Colletotrichum somersetense]
MLMRRGEKTDLDHGCHRLNIQIPRRPYMNHISFPPSTTGTAHPNRPRPCLGGVGNHTSRHPAPSELQIRGAHNRHPLTPATMKEA